MFEQVPVVVSHASVVHGLPSSQLAGTQGVPVPVAMRIVAVVLPDMPPKWPPGCPTKSIAVGDVEEAIHRPVGALLRELGEPGAGHSVARSAGDPQEIEIGIAGRKLALKMEHVGRELLNRCERGCADRRASRS